MLITWLRRLFLGTVEQIKAEDVQEQLKKGAILLDVRERHERDVLYILGSKALPLSELAQKWQSLPKDKDLIIQCRTGNRSARAASFLAKQGFKVKNLNGGLLAWQAANLPVKKA